MNEELISKKELLELTDISYGQLYRWKRKKLIPEDWFIRRSTFTGQETFFPKDQILARVARIKGMKDDLSLDELADVFSPTPAETSLTKEELLKRNIVSNMTISFYIEQHGDEEVFSFEKTLYLFIFEKLLSSGEISLDEGKNLLTTLQDHFPKFEGKNCELIFVRKMGMSIFMLISSQGEFYFDKGVKIIERLHLTNCIEELKMKLGSGGMPIGEQK